MRGGQDRDDKAEEGEEEVNSVTNLKKPQQYNEHPSRDKSYNSKLAYPKDKVGVGDMKGSDVDI